MTGDNDNKQPRQSGEREPDFEANLQQLEDIVARLEQGNIPLDEALQLYEDGINAYKGCRTLLQKAESRVVKLVENLEGELEEQELDPPGEEEQ